MSKRIPVTLSDEILEKIREDKNYISERKGFRSGYSGWIASLIESHFKLSSDDPHKKLSRERKGKPNPHHPSKHGRSTHPA